MIQYSYGQGSQTEFIFFKKLQQKSEPFTVESDFKKARFFFLEHEWDSTLVYTTKQLNIASNTSEIVNYCYLFRGYSFRKKKLYKEALKEFQKIPDDFFFYNHAIMYIGEVSIVLKDFDQAIVYLKQVEKLPQEELIGIEKNSIDENLGISYLLKEDLEKAEFYILKNIQFLEKEKDTSRLVKSYSNIANLYYNQYKDEQAISYFIKAYQLANTTDSFSLRQDVAFNMAFIEENRKDYKKAVQYRKEYEKWTDSVNDQNKIYATAKAEEKIAVEKEQKIVGILKAENKVKEAERNTFLYSAIILLLLLIAGFYFYHEKVKSNKIINAQKEDLDELNATKDKLFSIVSHDLRSSVNAIKTSNKKLITKLDTENNEEVKSLLNKNSSIVNSAYTLLDNLLNWAMLQAKQSFFQITKLRLATIVEHVSFNYKAILAEKEISFSTNIDKKTIVYADQESLKIILRNLIDNAIKFSNTKGNITIYSENNEPGFCHLIVEDTGIGMDNKTREELLKETNLLSKKKHENIIGTGLGMQLCKSMIKKNNGTFSIQSELGKGSKIIISLPKTLPNEPY